MDQIAYLKSSIKLVHQGTTNRVRDIHLDLISTLVVDNFLRCIKYKKIPSFLFLTVNNFLSKVNGFHLS